MIIDGKKIAEEIKQELKEKVSLLSKKPILSIVYVGSDPAVDSFIRIKKRFGEEIGVQVDVRRFEGSISQNELQDEIKKLSKKSDGIIVQLPLPFDFDTDEVLSVIPMDKDIDVLSKEAVQAFSLGELSIPPPVIGAVKEIFDQYKIDLGGKSIVVIGEGRLVGAPVILWLRSIGVKPEVLNEESENIGETLNDANVIISGAGSPGIIKPEMLKEGVVLIDAGTSTAGLSTKLGVNRIVGDADPDCASKCSIFTPVPGGIGPITVAMLFRNLIELSKNT